MFTGVFFLMKKKVFLITGASGFIGSAFVKFLETQENIECILVDRVHGYDFSREGWTKKLPDVSVDMIYHLAQSREYRNFPGGAQDMARINMMSTLELLEWARKHEAKRFFLASTGSIYSTENTQSTYIAETDPLLLSSMYASSKYSAELMAGHYRAFFDVIVGRLFTPYGPGQKNMLISNMVERVRKNEPITLAQNEGLYLTPMFIGDCVQVLFSLAQVKMDQQLLTLNLAGDEKLSLFDIVTQIGAALDISPNIQITEGNVISVCADTTVLKSLSLNKMRSFAEGLQCYLKEGLER